METKYTKVEVARIFKEMEMFEVLLNRRPELKKYLNKMRKLSDEASEAWGNLQVEKDIEFTFCLQRILRPVQNLADWSWKQINSEREGYIVAYAIQEELNKDPKCLDQLRENFSMVLGFENYRIPRNENGKVLSWK